jgi:hypothetical protein
MAHVEPVKFIDGKSAEELIADLKFIYHNRSDTFDLFLDEILPLIDYHVNESLGLYQERVLNEATNYFQGEIAGVLLRTRRDYRQELNKQIREERKELIEKIEQEEEIPKDKLHDW